MINHYWHSLVCYRVQLSSNDDALVANVKLQDERNKRGAGESELASIVLQEETTSADNNCQTSCQLRQAAVLMNSFTCR